MRRCVINANCCVIIGIRAKSFTEALTLNALHFINSNTPTETAPKFTILKRATKKGLFCVTLDSEILMYDCTLRFSHLRKL